jgi:hypothetical protein
MLIFIGWILAFFRISKKKSDQIPQLMHKNQGSLEAAAYGSASGRIWLGSISKPHKCTRKQFFYFLIRALEEEGFQEFDGPVSMISCWPGVMVWIFSECPL